MLRAGGSRRSSPQPHSTLRLLLARSTLRALIESDIEPSAVRLSNQMPDVVRRMRPGTACTNGAPITRPFWSYTIPSLAALPERRRQPVGRWARFRAERARNLPSACCASACRSWDTGAHPYTGCSHDSLNARVATPCRPCHARWRISGRPPPASWASKPQLTPAPGYPVGSCRAEGSNARPMDPGGSGVAMEAGTRARKAVEAIGRTGSAVTAGISSATTATKRTAVEANRRVVACSCLPVIQDMVSDRVASRWLTMAVWGMIALFVLRSVLAVLVLSTPTQDGAGVADVLQIRRSSGAPTSEIGRGFSPPIAARRTVADGSSGVVNTTIRAVLGVADDAVLWDRRWGFEGTPLAAHGIPVGRSAGSTAAASSGTVASNGGRFVLPGFVPAVYKSPVLQANAAVTNADGTALFSSTRPVLAVPGTYAIEALSADDQGLSAGGSRAVLRSSVDGVAVDADDRAAIEARRWATGAVLPPITVRITDAGGSPLSNKVCVALSAPRAAREFTGLLARPDVLWPRLAALDGAVSSPSTVRGAAVFRGLRVNSSSLETVLIRFACDGVLAPGLSGGADLQVDLATPPLRVEVVREPPADTVEGTPLAAQPSVRITARNCTGVPLRGASGLPCGTSDPWVPVSGLRAFAVIHGKHGSTLHTPLNEDQREELGAIGGPEAVLSSIGRAKALFGYESGPSGPDGVARWGNLGFIRHGPAGPYRIGFLVLSRFARSRWVVVNSSVASVRLLPPLEDDEDIIRAIGETIAIEPAAQDIDAAWAAPGAVKRANATVCTAPRAPCPAVPALNYGARYGSMLYKRSFDAAVRRCGLDVTEPQIRETSGMMQRAPTGSLSAAPGLVVLDAQGRPLAGKVADAFIVDASTRAHLPGFRVAEFPHRGSTKTGLGGAARYFPASADAFFGASRVVRAETTGDAGSFFRVVQAPAGATTGAALSLRVEGVDSAEAIPLRVDNDEPAEALATCAHIEVLEQPRSLEPIATGVQAGAWRVRAVNSLGQPRSGVRVSMHAVTAVGAVVYPAVEPRAFAGGSPSLQEALLRRKLRLEQMDDASWQATRLLGGMSAYAMGNVFSAWLGGEGARGLFGPVDSAVTDADGIATFSTFAFVTFSTPTYVRFGFVASTGIPVGLPPAFSPIFPRTAWFDFLEGANGTWWEFPFSSACVSQITEPVPVMPAVERLAWTTGPDPAAVTPTGETRGALDPALRYRLQDGAGDPLSEWPASAGVLPVTNLLAVVDAGLETFPASVFAGSLTYSAYPGLQSQAPARSEYDVRGLVWDSGFFGNDDWLEPRSERLGLPAYPVTNYLMPLGDVLRQGDFRSRFIQLNGVRTVRASVNNFVQPVYGALAQMLAIGGRPLIDTASAEGLDASFSNLTVIPGFAGRYRFVAASVGAVSYPYAPIRFNETGVTALEVYDYNGFARVLGTPSSTIEEPGPGLPPRLPPDCPGDSLPELSRAISCPGNCSFAQGRGACVCHLCVCAAGWDGAADCSVRVDAAGAADSIRFGTDPAFRGLPVVDLALPLTREARIAYDAGLDEPFPRLLLGAAMQAGTWEAGTRRRLTPELPRVQRPAIRHAETQGPWASVGAAVRDLLRPSEADRRDSDSHWEAEDAASGSGSRTGPKGRALGGTVSGTPFLDRLQRPSAMPGAHSGGRRLDGSGRRFRVTRTLGLYTAAPVLVRCSDGKLEPEAYFVGWDAPLLRINRTVAAAAVSDAALDRCRTVPVPAFTSVITGSYAGFTPEYFRRLYRVDRRLRLVAPPGCYRVVWAFGLDGGGSAGTPETRTTTLDLSRAAAVSRPMRPFRVLGPVRSIDVASDAPTATLTVPRGVAFPVNFTAVLTTRVPAGSSSELQERCIEPLTTACDFTAAGQSRPSGAVSRCPPTPELGLIVTVEAESVRTGARFPLFSRQAAQTGLHSDCALAAATSQATARALFASIVVPDDDDAPSVPDGSYVLRFSSYGVSARLESLVVRVRTTATRVTALSALRVTVNVTEPVFPDIEALVTLDPFDGGGDALTRLPVPGTIVTATLVSGPVNSNAALDSATTTVVAGARGVTDWQQLRLAAGKPGVYRVALEAAVGGTAEEAAPAAVTLTVLPLVSAITVSRGPRSQVVEGEQLFGVAGTRVCVTGLRGEPLSGQVLQPFLHRAIQLLTPSDCELPSRKGLPANATWTAQQLAAAAALPAACFELSPAGEATAADLPSELRPDGLVDNRTRANAELGLKELVTSAPDGCAAVPSIRLLRLGSSGSYDLVFRLTAGAHPGFESAPARFRGITIRSRQAQLVGSISGELTANIITPTALSLPLLWANTLYAGPVTRLALWTAAVAVSDIMLARFAFFVFPGDTAIAQRTYPPDETDMLVAMDVALQLAVCLTIAAQLAATFTVVQALVLRFCAPIMAPRGSCIARTACTACAVEDSSGSPAAADSIVLLGCSAMCLRCSAALRGLRSRNRCFGCALCCCDACCDGSAGDATLCHRACVCFVRRVCCRCCVAQLSKDTKEAASSASGGAAIASMASIEGANRTAYTGFFGHKLAMAFAYARERAPRIIAPLVRATGEPTEPFVEALADVFVRYAKPSWAPVGSGEAEAPAEGSETGGTPAKPGSAAAGDASGTAAPGGPCWAICGPSGLLGCPARCLCQPCAACGCDCTCECAAACCVNDDTDEPCDCFRNSVVVQSAARPSVVVTHLVSGRRTTCCGACLDKTVPSVLRGTVCYRWACLGLLGRSRELELRLCLDAAGVDRLRAELLQLHTGMDCRSMDRPAVNEALRRPLSLELAMKVVEHRIRRFRVVSTTHDLLRLRSALGERFRATMPRSQVMYLPEAESFGAVDRARRSTMMPRAGAAAAAQASAGSGAPAEESTAHASEAASGRSSGSKRLVRLSMRGASIVGETVSEMARARGTPSLSLGDFVAALVGHPSILCGAPKPTDTSLHAEELRLWLRLWCSSPAGTPPPAPGAPDPVPARLSF